MKPYKKYLLLTVLGVFFSISLFGQRNPARLADQAFERKQYSIAADRYRKAYNKVRRNPNERDRITYRMAESYRLTGNYRRAESTYRRLMRNEENVRDPILFLRYADVLKINGKFDESIEYYNKYSERVPDDPRGPLGAETAALIEEWLENPSKYEVTEIKRLNSRESDFAPAWGASNYREIIFTSTRESAPGREKDGWTNQSFSALFTARLDSKDEWSSPVLLGEVEVINTEANEGAPFMNSKFNTLYFTRCPNDERAQSNCQIFTSTRSGRSWSNPRPLQIRGIDTLDVIGHPTLTEDELIIYFAADRHTGFGGKDIWVAMRESSTQPFGRPLNIGPVVNTPGDEVFPFLRNDTTLYFASDGHGGMGGLDIYVTTIDTAGNWGLPRNLKHPINSSGDDFAIIFHPDDEYGFFSSNRNNNRGVDNLYYFIEPPVLFTLGGTIKNDKTLQFVEDAVVRLVGSDGMSVSTRTNENGYYLFGSSQLNKNTTYEIIVDKENYFTQTAIETTVGVEFSRDFVKDFMLEPIPEEPIPLPDILYELARWELLPQYEDSLQGLIETLQKNPTIIIELGSHTDNRDTEERNDILSQRRAQSVVDYLILRGIEPPRLVARGYGERVPRRLVRDMIVHGFRFSEGTVLTEEFIDNLPTVDHREAAHQLNRRTEFKVLSKDFVPRSAGVTSREIEIVTDPEDQSVGFEIDPNTGAFVLKAIIEGYTEDIVYERSAAASVSLEKALEMLRNGIIDRNSFEGEVERILTAGSIADRAIFKVKEIRIGPRVVQNAELVVSHALRYKIVFGQQLLSEFGEFEFDTTNKKLIFK
jgi:peptidoglycan-associated lipoprotein